MISGFTSIPSFFDAAGRLEDGARLHPRDLGEDDAEPAAAVPEHRVHLVELGHLRGPPSRRGRPSCFATSACSAGVCGRNSWSGGSSVRIVTGRGPIARKMPTKSSRCIGRSLASAFSRSSTRVGEDHLAHRPRSGPSPKNMCSVRQRPIPSAPNATAFGAWSGWSAFARTFRRRTVSAHPISVA